MWPPGNENHMETGELMRRSRADFISGAQDAVEKEQEWAKARGVCEEREELQHGGHVAPVVRAPCHDTEQHARKGSGGFALVDNLGPAACAAWLTSAEGREVSRMAVEVSPTVL